MDVTEPRPEPATPAARMGTGHLRISDADRDQVSALLGTAYAEGRITQEEHAERLEQVIAAKIFDDLRPVTADLVPVSPPAPLATRRNVPTDPALPSSPERLVGIFSGIKRTGHWRLRQRLHTVAVFSGIDLDLRSAVFEHPELEVSGLWCFGGLELKVPAGVVVRDETISIFGGTNLRDLGEPEPGAPTLVIRGVSLFGGVLVRGPKRKERGQTGRWLGHPG